MHAVFLLITVNAMAQDQTVSTLKTEAEKRLPKIQTILFQKMENRWNL